MLGLTVNGFDDSSTASAYQLMRQPDPRLARSIIDELGDAKSIVNVGAGLGSYEPNDRQVTAIDASREMIRGRRNAVGKALVADAQDLPFADGEFDAAMAVMTVQHWTNWRQGVREMCRVASDSVSIFTWDPTYSEAYWLVRDYFQVIAEMDHRFPPITEISNLLANPRVVQVPIPWDCRDGFLEAYWRRPERFFEPLVWRASSSLRRIADEQREEGLSRLDDDLKSGSWYKQNSPIIGLESLDLGFRIISGEPRNEL